MAKRGPLDLLPEDKAKLLKISRRRTESVGKVRRANIILLYSRGNRISEITRTIKTNRPLVERVIDKAFTFGPLKALEDLPRPGRPVIVDDEAKSWVLSIACQKPARFWLRL